jgi:hypothetical protein
LEIKDALTERMKECGLALHPLKIKSASYKDMDRTKIYLMNGENV